MLFSTRIIYKRKNEILITWGYGIVHMRDNIIMQYNYFGLFWVFTMCTDAHYYAVTGLENRIIRELSLDEVGVKNPWSRVPIYRRYGLAMFIVLFLGPIIHKIW